mgnify:FL=1
MLQNELLACFEELAPVALAAPWDNSGLQIAAHRDEINHIAVTLDPCPESVQKALAIKADLIFTHHPLLLSPKYLNNLDDTYYKTASLLIKNDIPLYSAHTCLDSMPVAFWLADEFGLTNRKILEPTGEIENIQYGIGVCGELASPLFSDTFYTKLCKFLPHTRPFFSIGKLPESIKSIALCGGSGSSLMDEAKNFGADCLITGDTKYHTALDLTQESKDFAIIEVGHHSLEEEMMKRFALILQKRLPGLRISFIPSKDPFIQIME